MKRLLSILIAFLMIFCLTACETEEPTVGYTVSLPRAETETNFVQFTMSDGMTFVIELCPQYAPATVLHFKELVSQGFYDGLTFHRIYEGFMIQGGDPDGDGISSPDQKTVYGEFSDNGFSQNILSHERGVISMARLSTDYDSATSQFFIMHETNARLDGQYAAFGRVVAGMESIDVLATVPVTYQSYSNERSKPITPPVIQSAYFVNYTAPAAGN